MSGQEKRILSLEDVASIQRMVADVSVVLKAHEQKADSDFVQSLAGELSEYVCDVARTCERLGQRGGE